MEQLTTIYVPKGLLELYQNPSWKRAIEKIGKKFDSVV
jgi:hypothetical protein